MDDEHGWRIARGAAAFVAGVGTFGLFMILFLLAGLFYFHPTATGWSQTIAVLTVGAALSSLVAGLLIAGGRYTLATAALVVAAALSAPMVRAYVPFVFVLLALLTPWWWDRL